MNVSTEEKKAEAIARMKALGIFPKMVKFFAQKDVVSFSSPPFGARYWVEDDVLDRFSG